jgi:two-component system NtrC family response regulator
VVAASNRDLKEEVTKGHFRADLFYRLNVVQFHLPPLRERRDDIPLLVNHFLAKYAKESHLTSLAVTPEAMRHLLDYPWPGNVRQLENVIERAVILCGGEHITERDLAPEIRAPAQLPPEGAAHGAFGEPFAGRSTESVGPAPDSRVEWQPQDSSQRQQRALGFIRSHGFITNKYYSGMNGISERQALRELSEMVDRGVLLRTGKGRSCRYVLPRELA